MAGVTGVGVGGRRLPCQVTPPKLANAKPDRKRQRQTERNDGLFEHPPNFLSQVFTALGKQMLYYTAVLLLYLVQFCQVTMPNSRPHIFIFTFNLPLQFRPTVYMVHPCNAVISVTSVLVYL